MAKWWLFAALAVGLIAAAGCEDKKPTESAGGEKKGRQVAKAAVKEDDEDAKHAGWWCDEHGLTEDECSMCKKAVFKKLKPEEICPKHPDRAKDQCFICNPELWEKSKARYVAKYGKEPPEPDANMPGKK